MLVHLHVPHTGGRYLKHQVWNQSIPLKSIHQVESLNPDDQRYLVLRDPIVRAWAEFIHYSAAYDRVGRVNHLSKEELGLDLSTYSQYFSLEINRNVYCKFILGTTEPITEQSFQNVLNCKLAFDRFSDSLSLPVLAKLLQIDQGIFIGGKRPQSTVHIIPDQFIELMSDCQNYDVRLFNHLISQSS